MGIEINIYLCNKKQHLLAYKLFGITNEIFPHNLFLLDEKKTSFKFY